MLGKMTNPQIDTILHSQYVGRIGCCVDQQPYVVPVTFAYDGTYLYATSKEGQKIDMMRKNPHVCLEVDIIDNMANWRSVVVIGLYQELVDEHDRKKSLTLLTEKVMPLITSQTVKPKQPTLSSQIIEKEKRPILFRIKIKEKTGRYEKTQV